MAEQTKSADERQLTEFILDRLPTNGYVTYDFIVETCVNNAAIKTGTVYERLEQLKQEGRITCSPDGTRWKLRPKPLKYPVTEEVLSDGT